MFQDQLTLVQIALKAPCEEYPYLGMEEAYTLSVEKDVAHIESYSIWGILRALESFSQLIVLTDDGGAVSKLIHAIKGCLLEKKLKKFVKEIEVLVLGNYEISVKISKTLPHKDKEVYLCLQYQIVCIGDLTHHAINVANIFKRLYSLIQVQTIIKCEKKYPCSLFFKGQNKIRPLQFL